METFDQLNLNQEKFIQKQLENGEIILFSGPVFKFNEVNKKQERTLVVTNRYLVNIAKTTIKRKIQMKKITALTLSTIGDEFILHVPDEYDYRFSVPEKRDQAIICILVALRVSIPIFYKDDFNLSQYTTTKIDKKKGIDNQPRDGAIITNLEGFKKRLKAIEEEQSVQKSRSSVTIYSKKKGEDVTINDFSIIKVLGRGAFGKVMLVERKQDKQIYALKSIRKGDILDPETFEHTKTERIVLEQANNPFLVHLIYAFQTDEKLFFVTEFMKGGELFQHLRQVKRFDENRAKFYSAEIILAFEHLHQKNIIYRDLKPENVLLDENGHVCLTDFGMAKILKKNELALSLCGTPEYLAPEQIKEIGHSMAADWWALGIFTYEMLFSYPAFYHKNQDMMFKKIQTSDVVFPSIPLVSEEAKDFIRKLLIKEPKKRLGAFGVGEIKAHPWFKNLNWDLLSKKQIEPPFQPKVQGDQWQDNFDKQFLEEDAINSYAPKSDLIDQEEFKTFDFFK